MGRVVLETVIIGNLGVENSEAGGWVHRSPPRGSEGTWANTGMIRSVIHLITWGIKTGDI